MVRFLPAPLGALSRLNDNRGMPARLSAFVIWALVVAIATFWGLRLFVRAPAAPAHTLAVADSAPVRADLTRLFGAPPVVAAAAVAVPAISSRFQLAGVMAPKVPGQQGVALIAVDGKMPRAFQIGSRIDGELTLQAVSLRTASIGPAQGAAAVVLELPPLPSPATGTLPSVGAGAPTTEGPVPRAAPRPAPVVPQAAQTLPGGRLLPPRHSRGFAAPPRDPSQAQ
jgi:general secretion pathway protein C